MKSSILKHPYLTQSSPSFRLIQALSFGIFVSLFLMIFKPFRIDELGKHLTMAALGFGGVTFLAMAFLNVLIPAMFRQYFEEERWTVGKEIFYTLLNVWLIGLFNFLFFNVFMGSRFSIDSLLWFQFSTITIGIFPVTIYTLLREKISRQKYSKGAVSLSAELGTARHKNSDEVVELRSRDGKENLVYPIDRLYFIKASDNYAEIHYLDDSMQMDLVRNTLKEISEDLSKYGQMFRCHKSYIVNFDLVTAISGNAQGYKLHLDGYEKTIPVSRQHNNLINQRLASRH